MLDECQEYLLERISRDEMAKLKSFKGMSSESTFVYVVVNNLIKDYLKTKKIVISYDESIPESYSAVSPHSEEDLIKEIDEERVTASLQTLSSEEQLIIKLRYYDEYPIHEIASLLDKTPKQLSKKIETIKNRLKKLLNREDFSF